MESYQHTVKRPVRLSGVGLHSGREVSLAILPAEVNSGLRFRRIDLGQEEPTPAFMDRVADTRLATTLATADDEPIGTTEHLLAALLGLGIDNALIELDGPEVPIMDGSAEPFARLLKRVGRKRQKANRWMLRFKRELSFAEEGREVRILPYNGFKVSCEIDFAHPSIGRQTMSMEVNPRSFLRELAAARTFGFLHEVEMMRQNGLARGGSLGNAIVVDDDGVVNREGLRYANEFVRHKALDLVGDLALLGFPLLGHVVARRSGHGQHFGLLQQVAAHADAWDLVSYQGHGESRALKKLVLSTRAAGDRLLPYLVPPSLAFASEPCAA